MLWRLYFSLEALVSVFLREGSPHTILGYHSPPHSNKLSAQHGVRGCRMGKVAMPGGRGTSIAALPG